MAGILQPPLRRGRRQVRGRVIDEQFDPDRFVPAQMMILDITTGRLQWANAGHPAPLLIRDRVAVDPAGEPDHVAGRLRR